MRLVRLFAKRRMLRKRRRAQVYITVRLPDAGTYWQFHEHVSRTYNSAALLEANAPIAFCVRIRPWLFDATKKQFSLTLVTAKEIWIARQLCSHPATILVA